MPSPADALIRLIPVIILIPINALILWGVLKLFKLKKKEYLEALKVAAIAAIILFGIGGVIGLAFDSVTTQVIQPAMLTVLGMLFLTISLAATVAVNSFLVKRFYKQKTKQAVLIGTIWMLANWTVAMVLGIIVFAAAMSGAVSPSIGSGGLA
jgi:hypothetical protein